jgi:hypothetical protein
MTQFRPKNMILLTIARLMYPRVYRRSILKIILVKIVKKVMCVMAHPKSCVLRVIIVQATGLRLNVLQVDMVKVWVKYI